MLDSWRNRELRLNRSLIGLIAKMELLLLQYKIFVGNLRDRGWVERLGERYDDIDVAILRPDGRNVLWDITVCRALVELLRAKLERRNTLDIPRDCNGFTSFGIGDCNSSLVLFQGQVEGRIDAKVDGAAEEKLVEAETLDRIDISVWLRCKVYFAMTYTTAAATLLLLALTGRQDLSFSHCVCFDSIAENDRRCAMG